MFRVKIDEWLIIKAYVYEYLEGIMEIRSL